MGRKKLEESEKIVCLKVWVKTKHSLKVSKELLAIKKKYKR